MLAAQLTVTVCPTGLAVGVAPALTLEAAAAPLPPGTEPALQYAHAVAATMVRATEAATVARCFFTGRFTVLPPGRR